MTLVCLSAPGSSSAQDGPLTVTSSGMTLVGSDDFDGSADSLPNPRFWGYDVGANGWGNDERQAYTSDTRNVRLNGAGEMVIEADRAGGGFTSARVVTRGRTDFSYGLLEVRAKLPEGQGLHPAIWLLGSNIDSVGWPAAGEIDVIELVNSGATFHNGLHGPKRGNPGQQWTVSSDGPAPGNLSADYHLYQVLRRPDQVTIAIDGTVVGRYDRSAMAPDTDWVFNGPMYLLMNVAVGGRWPGPVSDRTAFPAEMSVDSVRYYQ